MSKYCPECGVKLNDSAEFCSSCGSKINETPKPKETKQKKWIVIGLIIIIAILAAVLFTTTMKTETLLTIKSETTLTTEDEFVLKLTSEGKNLNNGKIHVVFDKNGQAFEFDTTTNSKGIAKITPNLNVGDYEVACKFEGSEKYAESYATTSISIEEAEPDYASFHYSVSFEDTDKNNDGYVLLTDMNMPHTPQDIQYQMYADSDDDHDGKLNHDEYYKFMYKLNYDRGSYGL